MQNVGDALGVAIIGVIFFGALHSGYAHAFELSLGALAAILLAVAALTRLLPPPAPAPARAPASDHAAESVPARA
jgi:membrane protease YdiL (CAAX protease family)